MAFYLFSLYFFFSLSLGAQVARTNLRCPDKATKLKGSGKMMLVRIIENVKIYAYFRSG